MTDNRYCPQDCMYLISSPVAAVYNCAHPDQPAIELGVSSRGYGFPLRYPVRTDACEGSDYYKPMGEEAEIFRMLKAVGALDKAPAAIITTDNRACTPTPKVVEERPPLILATVPPIIIDTEDEEAGTVQLNFLSHEDDDA